MDDIDDIMADLTDGSISNDDSGSEDNFAEKADRDEVEQKINFNNSSLSQHIVFKETEYAIGLPVSESMMEELLPSDDLEAVVEITASHCSYAPVRTQVDFRQLQFLDARSIKEMKRSTKLVTSHINGVLAIMRQQFPEIGGLYNVQHGEKGNYPAPENKIWMQIMNNNLCHWLLVVSGFPLCGGNDVAVFDSIGFDCDNDKFSVSTISNLVGNKEFTLITPSCQKQTDRTSCGVFAIAFATSIALGLDPSTLVFEKEAKMREHLKDCLTHTSLNCIPDDF